MGRIRSIKPEFFLHEDLAAMSPVHRLLFVGLWTLADRDGRLEDRPRRIKVALMPWEDCDIDALLWDLAEARLIVRYDARTPEGQPTEAIAIPGFRKHQRPHPKESSFGLSEPGPSAASRERPRKEIKDPDPIPSSPAGKEILESRKEILVCGSGHLAGAEAPPKRRRARKSGDDAPTDPRFTPMRDALVADFLEIRHAPFAFDGFQAKRLKEVLALGSDEEIRARWRRGLRGQFKERVDDLDDLKRKWNALTGEMPPPGQVHDIRKSPVRSEDVDRSAFKETKTIDAREAFGEF